MGHKVTTRTDAAHTPSPIRPDVAPLDKDLAFVRELLATFRDIGGIDRPGWTRDFVLTHIKDADHQTQALLLGTLVLMNADAIEANMARTDAPGLRAGAGDRSPAPA